MYRCQDFGLVDNQDGLTTHPDYLHDALNELISSAGTHFDAIWHHCSEQDPFELERLRRKQKTYLARYMRQSIDYWDTAETIELNDYVSEVSELLKSENGPNQIEE